MATWHQHLFQSCIVKRGFVVDMKYNNGSHIILLKDPQLIRYKMVPIVHVAAAAVLQQPPAAGRHQNRRSNELNWFHGRSPWSLPRRGRHVVTTLISTKPSQFQVCRNYKIFAFQTRDSCQSRDQPAAVSSLQWSEWSQHRPARLQCHPAQTQVLLSKTAQIYLNKYIYA